MAQGKKIRQQKPDWDFLSGMWLPRQNIKGDVLQENAFLKNKFKKGMAKGSLEEGRKCKGLSWSELQWWEINLWHPVDTIFYWLLHHFERAFKLMAH